MRVGLTYDLRSEYLAMGYGKEETAELDKEETVDAIEGELKALGFETERIGNVLSLTKLLARGKTWDIVFNIAEGVHGIGREAQVPALLDAFSIPYTFSDPLVLALTLHKAMTKRVVRDCGVPTAPFAVVEGAEDIEGVSLPFPLFVKPVGEGTGKGIGAASLVGSAGELAAVCLELLARFRQAVLVERYLPGREFTVGVIGTGKKAEALPVMEILLKEKAQVGAYSYENKQNYREVVDYRLIDGELAGMCSDVSLRAWRCLGCRDAGRVDLRLDERGVPNFIEVNPLAGLNPVDSDLPIICRLAGKSYRGLIGGIMESALERVGGGGPGAANAASAASSGAAAGSGLRVRRRTDGG
jgi:D-alanine-D-alanine ligase